MTPFWLSPLIDLFVRLFGRSCADTRRSEYQRRLRALRKIIDDDEKKKASILRELRQAERRLEALYDRSRRIALRRRALDPNPYGRANDDTCSLGTDDVEYIEDATPVDRPSRASGSSNKAPGE